MTATDTILYYVHDPMCSWCWGYRPTWGQLRSALPGHIEIANVMGGLAPDNDQSMPADLQLTIQGHWKNIQATLGTEFNFDFWLRCRPRRDTYKACRAVVTAAAYGLEEAMIESIQRAYYLRAMNPSEPETLAQLAGEIGLDEASFAQELLSGETEAEFQRQLDLASQLGANRFPSLVLKTNQAIRPITLDYLDHSVSLGEICAQ